MKKKKIDVGTWVVVVEGQYPTNFFREGAVGRVVAFTTPSDFATVRFYTRALLVRKGNNPEWHVSTYKLQPIDEETALNLITIQGGTYDEQHVE